MCCVCSLVLALDVKYFGNNINIINNDDNNKDVKTHGSVTCAPPCHSPTPTATLRSLCGGNSQAKAGAWWAPVGLT